MRTAADGIHLEDASIVENFFFMEQIKQWIASEMAKLNIGNIFGFLPDDLVSGFNRPTLAREQLEVQKAALDAQLAANPRDFIQLAFRRAGQDVPPELQGTAARTQGGHNVQGPSISGTDALRMQLGRTGLSGFDDGATVEGPVIATVGESDLEYALLAPGSVVAPRGNPNEPATMRNAVAAIQRQLGLAGGSPPLADGLIQAEHGVTVGDKTFREDLTAQDFADIFRAQGLEAEANEIMLWTEEAQEGLSPGDPNYRDLVNDPRVLTFGGFPQHLIDRLDIDQIDVIYFQGDNFGGEADEYGQFIMGQLDGYYGSLDDLGNPTAGTQDWLDAMANNIPEGLDEHGVFDVNILDDWAVGQYGYNSPRRPAPVENFEHLATIPVIEDLLQFTSSTPFPGVGATADAFPDIQPINPFNAQVGFDLLDLNPTDLAHVEGFQSALGIPKGDTEFQANKTTTGFGLAPSGARTAFRPLF